MWRRCASDTSKCGRRGDAGRSRHRGLRQLRCHQAHSRFDSSKGTAGDKKVVTAQAICDAAQPADVESTLSGASGPATPSEPKKGLHACSWTAVDTEHAVVAVVFDDAFDKNFVDDPVSLTNDLAGSNFPTATNVTLDVGAHNVTVYGLSEASDRVAYAPLSKIANTLNDVIVEADS
ncbi:MAG: hypothetical protein JWN96_1008 [Mycobacterium sp.]|nr:hypothetical protein [Mycobacterium sp.]